MRTTAGLIAALVLVVAGCADGSAAERSAGPQVVVTFSILADITGEIVGDDVTIATLVPLGGDPHGYEPAPSDAAAVADADLVIDNGLGLAPWFPALASRAEGELLSLGDALADAAVTDEEGDIDPHLWMVPSVVADRYVPAITEAVIAIDPDNADAHRERAEAYAEELRALDAEIEATLAAIPDDQRLLVTSHDAYSYFGERYGIQVATPIGFSTEEQPSAATVAALVDQVRDSGVPTIFVESTVHPGVIQRIAADAGVDIGDPLYGDSVGEAGTDAGSYAGMLRANAAALVDGLAR